MLRSPQLNTDCDVTIPWDCSKNTHCEIPGHKCAGRGSRAGGDRKGCKWQTNLWDMAATDSSPRSGGEHWNMSSFCPTVKKTKLASDIMARGICCCVVGNHRKLCRLSMRIHVYFWRTCRGHGRRLFLVPSYLNYTSHTEPQQQQQQQQQKGALPAVGANIKYPLWVFNKP